MTPRKLILLWFGVVVCFGCYGFFGPGHKYAVETGDREFFRQIELAQMLFFGGIGFGVATSVSAGMHIIRKVRAKLLKQGLAILLMAVSSAVSMIVPPLVMAQSGLFRGELGLLDLYLESGLLFCIGLLSFVSFSIAVLRDHQ
jgi:hypothetical protein